MPRHHTVDYGEPDAGTAELVSPTQPLKDAEKSLRVLHVESGAIVLNRITYFAVLELAADLNNRLISLGAVFYGVADKVCHHGTPHTPAAKDGGQSANFNWGRRPGGPSRAPARQDIRNDLPHQRPHI